QRPAIRGERYHKRGIRLDAARQAHPLDSIARCRDRAFGVSEHVAKPALGSSYEEREEALRRAAYEIPEIGRTTRQPRHQRVKPWVRRGEPCQCLAGGRTGDFGEPVVDPRTRLVRGLKLWRRRDPSPERAVACSG